MCGIVKVRRIDGKKANNKVIHEYNLQKWRGSEGFGFCGIKNGKMRSYIRHTTEEDIFGLLREDDSTDIMFHHRYPTSTDNIMEASHPIKVENKELDSIFYVVHNGIITNCQRLKTKHELLGYQYTTTVTKYLKTMYSEYFYDSQFNDSESLAIELARYLSGKCDSIETVGSVAFIVLETDRKGNVKKLHYGRNEGNPLTISVTNKVEVIASVGGVMIKSNTLYTYNYKKNRTDQKPFKVGTYSLPAYPTSYSATNWGHDAGIADDDSMYAEDSEYESENNKAKKKMLAQKEIERLEWDLYEAQEAFDYAKVNDIEEKIFELELSCEGY